MNVEVSVLWSVSLGNSHSSIRNILNGLQENVHVITKLSSLCYMCWYSLMGRYNIRLSTVSYRPTRYSRSNPLSLSLCMAFTCSEKWDLCTTRDGWDADSAMAGDYSRYTILKRYMHRYISFWRHPQAKTISANKAVQAVVLYLDCHWLLAVGSFQCSHYPPL